MNFIFFLELIFNEGLDEYFTGNPTNFGLHGKLTNKWQGQIANETQGDYHTTYRADFLKTENDDMVKTRYAFPRQHSTSLHKANSINKDLRLRDKCVFHSPEKLHLWKILGVLCS